MSEPTLDQVLACMADLAAGIASCRWREWRKRRQLAASLAAQVPLAVAARNREQ